MKKTSPGADDEHGRRKLLVAAGRVDRRSDCLSASPDLPGPVPARVTAAPRFPGLSDKLTARAVVNKTPDVLLDDRSLVPIGGNIPEIGTDQVQNPRIRSVARKGSSSSGAERHVTGENHEVGPNFLHQPPHIHFLEDFGLLAPQTVDGTEHPRNRGAPTRVGRLRTITATSHRGYRYPEAFTGITGLHASSDRPDHSAAMPPFSVFRSPSCTAPGLDRPDTPVRQARATPSRASR